MPKSKLFDQEEVLDKIMNLFWEKGFNGTSIDDLVQTAGINRSSLYDTFGDKESLYLLALKRYREKSKDFIEQSCQKETSPRKKIESFFAYTIKDILNEEYGKGCFMLNATSELANQWKEVSKEAGDNYDALENYFLQWIKQGQALGEINTQHKPKALARYLVSSLNGLRLLGQTKKDKEILKDIVSIVLKSLD
jgi:TetR/AcrR family transcriptional regulator, transcriptional repressor for nem operon